jgi:hypothetical protein
MEVAQTEVLENPDALQFRFEILHIHGVKVMCWQEKRRSLFHIFLKLCKYALLYSHVTL